MAFMWGQNYLRVPITIKRPNLLEMLIVSSASSIICT